MWTSPTRPSHPHNTMRALMAFVAMGVVLAAALYAFAGGLSRVVVESNPAGAEVIVGGQVVGTTPASLELPADGDKVRITVKKSGYKTRTIGVTPVEGKTRRVKVDLTPTE